MKSKIFLSLLLICILHTVNAQYRYAFTFSGTGASTSSDGPPNVATFYYPQKMCMDPSGNFYHVDYRTNKVRKLTREGVATTVAGTGWAGSADGPGNVATFRGPSGICLDASGNLFIVDQGNQNIRKITPAGVVSTFAGPCPSNNQHGTANGTGTAARFYCPEDICMDPTTGNFYVADGCNNRIRMITPAGVVTTLTGSTAGFADGTLATAQFNYPCSVDCDTYGNLYVCDLMNRKIRKITPAGIVSTLAGTGAASGIDGPANAASFNYPYDVCLDNNGNIFVADGWNHKIRQISPAGMVTSLAGTGSPAIATNGYGTGAGFSYPTGVCTDAIGNIFVCNYANNRITKICLPCTTAPMYDYVVPTGGTTTSALFGGVTNIVNKSIYVIEPLTIDNNMTFSGCNIVVANSLSLPLTTGDLTLTNQTHIYACNNMWNGITVPAGRTLTTSGDVFIEDALQAITMDPGAVVTIDHTIFNNNLTAIEVGATTAAGSPLSISGSVITSRTIPFNVNPVLNPTVSSVIANITSATPYTASVLKAPYNDRKGCYGIKATDVALLNIGLNASNQTNYFDAIMCGIHLTRTNSNVYNNKFQYLLGYGGAIACQLGGPCYYESGYGIIAGGSTAGAYSINIGGLGTYEGNTFYNTFGAISVADYKTHSIINNSIDNSVTGPFTMWSTSYGSMGIYVRPIVGQSVTIKSNPLIRNCATGISLNRTQQSCVNTQGILIDNNTITANASGYCTTGINMQDVIGSTAASSPPSVTMRISNNNITEAQNCIAVTSVKNGLTISSNDGMGIAYNATALRYGVRVQNCENVVIYDNQNIHCTTPNAYTQASANIRGIYYLNTRVAQVQCNELNNITTALMFEGNCSGILQPTLVRGNVLNSCRYGLYLKNGAELNQQGNSMVPSENLYYGPFSSGYQTFTDNVSNANTNSVFYVRSNNLGLPTIPTLHGGTNPYVNGTGAGAGIVSMVANNFSGWCGVITRQANPNGDEMVTYELDPEINRGKSNLISTSLYPNPSDGKITLDYILPENEKGILTIKDVTGKTISTYNFDSSASQLFISEEQLKDGIYFYEINVSDHYIKRDKLIITK